MWEPLVFSWSVRGTGDNLNLQLVSEFQGGGHGNLQSVARWSEAQVTTRAFYWHMRVGSVRTELLVG